MRKKLILSDGTRDRELQLVGRIVVGRDPSCEVSHDDSLLSRRHAEFVTLGDEVTVRDLGSRNGVFVNGARAAEHRLEAGDVVQIGPLRARYVVDEGSVSIVPEEMDEERTAVFRGPIDLAIAPPETSKSVGSPAIISSIPAFTDSVAEFDSEEEEEEVTRLVPAPRMPKPALSAARPATVQTPSAPSSAAAVIEDDEVTHFSKAPRFTIPPPVAPSPALKPAAHVHAARVEPVAPANHSGAFVYFAVGILAFIVLASTAPLLTAASTSAVAIPVGVAIVGTIVVGSLINRRITRALGAAERKET